MIIELMLVFAAQITSTPVAIPIQNASFELPTNLPDYNACGQSTWRDIPGWTFHQIPGSGYGVIAWTCQPVPDGKQVAFLAYGSSMSQDLKVLPQAGIYNLKLFMANWFYSYEASYVVSLLIGGKPVCSIQGYALGDFTEYTLPCTIIGHIAVDHSLGFTGNLGISISSDVGGIIVNRGWPLLVDNVSLTFTPTN